MHNNFKATLTKKIGSRLLHGSNLSYFSKLIREMNLIPDADTEKPRELYDLLLTLGFGFHHDEDIRGSIELFKAAKELLQDKVIDNVAQLEEE